ncbi:MAG TPA: DUF3107 family protein [Actinomycetota bacterium]|nr:DUF3107 family protein [Actinomycetota bacterium]
MEVVFGVEATERGLRVELEEKEVEALRKKIEGIFEDGATGQILWITDRNGRVLGIPVGKLVYIELGADKAERRVGFSAKTG